MQLRPAGNERSRSLMEPTYRNRNQVDGVVDQRDDLMATCYAHLQSALSVIEELSRQSVAPSDHYCYEQAEGHQNVDRRALEGDIAIPGSERSA
jgi:hypothetical protein